MSSQTASGAARQQQQRLFSSSKQKYRRYSCTPSYANPRVDQPHNFDNFGGEQQQNFGAVPSNPNNANDDFHSSLTTAAIPRYRPCPKPLDEVYCFNGGTCLAEFDERWGNSRFLPFCKCAMNYHGRRCQMTFDPDLYGLSVFKNEVETAGAPLVLSFFGILILLTVIICLLTRKRRSWTN